MIKEPDMKNFNPFEKAKDSDVLKKKDLAKLEEDLANDDNFMIADNFQKFASKYSSFKNRKYMIGGNNEDLHDSTL